MTQDRDPDKLAITGWHRVPYHAMLVLGCVMLVLSAMQLQPAYSLLGALHMIVAFWRLSATEEE